MTIIESIYRVKEVGEIDTLPEDDRVREPLNATFDNPDKDVWNGDSFKTYPVAIIFGLTQIVICVKPNIIPKLLFSELVIFVCDKLII